MGTTLKQHHNQVIKDSKEFLDYLNGLIPIDEIESVTDKLIKLIHKHIEFSNHEINLKYNEKGSNKLSQQTEVIVEVLHDLISKQYDFLFQKMKKEFDNKKVEVLDDER